MVWLGRDPRGVGWERGGKRVLSAVDANLGEHKRPCLGDWEMQVCGQNNETLDNTPRITAAELIE